MVEATGSESKEAMISNEREAQSKDYEAEEQVVHTDCKVPVHVHVSNWCVEVDFVLLNSQALLKAVP